jgi:hypothetical protein
VDEGEAQQGTAVVPVEAVEVVVCGCSACGCDAAAYLEVRGR